MQWGGGAELAYGPSLPRGRDANPRQVLSPRTPPPPAPPSSALACRGPSEIRLGSAPR